LTWPVNTSVTILLAAMLLSAYTLNCDHTPCSTKHTAIQHTAKPDRRHDLHVLHYSGLPSRSVQQLTPCSIVHMLATAQRFTGPRREIFPVRLSCHGTEKSFLLRCILTIVFTAVVFVFLQSALMQAGDIEPNPGPGLSYTRNSNMSLSRTTHNTTNEDGFARMEFLFTRQEERLSRRMEEFEGNVLNHIKSSVAAIEHKIYGLEEKTADLEAHVMQMKCEFEDKLDKLEAHSRRDNLKFFGIQCSEDESYGGCVETILNILCEVLPGKHWTSDDIVRAHRLGYNPSSHRPPPMIVKFSRWSDKMLVLTQGRDELKRRNIEVAGDLTTQQQQTIKYHRQNGQRAYYKAGKLIVEGPLQHRTLNKGSYAQAAKSSADRDGSSYDMTHRQDNEWRPTNTSRYDQSYPPPERQQQTQRHEQHIHRQQPFFQPRGQDQPRQQASDPPRQRNDIRSNRQSFRPTTDTKNRQTNQRTHQGHQQGSHPAPWKNHQSAQTDLRTPQANRSERRITQNENSASQSQASHDADRQIQPPPPDRSQDNAHRTTQITQHEETVQHLESRTVDNNETTHKTSHTEAANGNKETGPSAETEQGRQGQENFSDDEHLTDNETFNSDSEQEEVDENIDTGAAATAEDGLFVDAETEIQPPTSTQNSPSDVIAQETQKTAIHADGSTPGNQVAGEHNRPQSRGEKETQAKDKSLPRTNQHQTRSSTREDTSAKSRTRQASKTKADSGSRGRQGRITDAFQQTNN